MHPDKSQLDFCHFSEFAALFLLSPFICINFKLIYLSFITFIGTSSHTRLVFTPYKPVWSNVSFVLLNFPSFNFFLGLWKLWICEELFFASATSFSQFLSWPLDRFLFFLHFASLLYVAFFLLPLSHWGKQLFQSCLFSLPLISLLPRLTERGGKGEGLECSLHFCPTSLRGLPFQTNKQTHRHLQTKDKKWKCEWNWFLMAVPRISQLNEVLPCGHWTWAWASKKKCNISSKKVPHGSMHYLSGNTETCGGHRQLSDLIISLPR